MKTLAPIHRKSVNQAAHAAALRFEIENRDRWIAELTEALEAGASFQELQERIETLSPQRQSLPIDREARSSKTY